MQDIQNMKNILIIHSAWATKPTSEKNSGAKITLNENIYLDRYDLKTHS